MIRFFKVYFVPGFIFQSLVIGGGYGTGREIVEFFLSEGPIGGILGIIVSMICWSFIMAVSFEWARMTRSFDYKSFIDGLLGKGWIAYEAIYLASLVLIISVLGASSGEILNSMTGLAPLYGIIIMMVGIAILAYLGSKIIERVMSFWSIALYLVYAAIIIVTVSKFGARISDNLSAQQESSNWFMAGIRYASYNISILPAVLFVARHFENRREALISGTIGGVLAIIPAFLIYFALLSNYPAILEKDIPTEYLLKAIDIPLFTLLFQIILLGTFIETGIGMIHGFNERISGVYQRKGNKMPSYLRMGIAIIILVFTVFLADAVGIISLIAKGYNFMAYAALLVFVIPVVIIGSKKIFFDRRK